LIVVLRRVSSIVAIFITRTNLQAINLAGKSI